MSLAIALTIGVLLLVVVVWTYSRHAAQSKQPLDQQSVMPSAKLEGCRERWHFFESKGPEYSMPIKRCYVPKGIPRMVGNFYAALYPKADFKDLLDFELFQFYSSSIQQDLIRTGEVNREWFHPESAEVGVQRFLATPKRVDSDDIKQKLSELDLPKDARWLLTIKYLDWNGCIDSSGIELTADTDEGYLTVFLVDD